MPGAGHYPHVESADRFWAAAEQFLAGRWPAEAQGPARPVAAR
ncbi:MAG TPA: hypothetical protein VK939_14535 [Longimicrobiales bacterium]|nr:hypothetical protein [Longimicrobiales bacterium]